jgi:hypothetical protein
MTWPKHHQITLVMASMNRIYVKVRPVISISTCNIYQSYVGSNCQWAVTLSADTASWNHRLVWVTDLSITPVLPVTDYEYLGLNSCNAWSLIMRAQPGNLTVILQYRHIGPNQEQSQNTQIRPEITDSAWLDSLTGKVTYKYPTGGI